MKTSLVTGANGFVGHSLCCYLREKMLNVRGSVRSLYHFKSGDDICVVGNLSSKTDWTAALSDVDTVYHLASTVHRPDITDPSVYRETIVDASINLARQAQAAGVQRFVYVSSSHVYSPSDSPLKENADKTPLSAYGKAKLAAEEALLEFAQRTQWEVVVVRPPLVYGKNVKANFKSLITLVKRFSFLPFGKANAKRSFIGIHNLMSFLHLCGTEANAKNQIFNISDDEDLSVAQFCQLIANVLKKKTYLLPIPEALIKTILLSLHKNDVYEKLFKPFQLDITSAKQNLNWTPTLSVQQELMKLLVPSTCGGILK